MEGSKRAAVFCIIISGDKVLLLKRNYEPNKGKYVPPGGKIEPYESPNDAVVREIKEETGLDLDLIQFCGILTETSPTSYNWISYIYVAYIQYVKINSCDEGEFHWISIDEISNIDTPPTDHFIYKYIMEEKQFIFNAIYDENLMMVKMIDDLSGHILYNNN